MKTPIGKNTPRNLIPKADVLYTPDFPNICDGILYMREEAVDMTVYVRRVLYSTKYVYVSLYIQACVDT